MSRVDFNHSFIIWCKTSFYLSYYFAFTTVERLFNAVNDPFIYRQLDLIILNAINPSGFRNIIVNCNIFKLYYYMIFLLPLIRYVISVKYIFSRSLNDKNYHRRIIIGYFKSSFIKKIFYYIIEFNRLILFRFYINHHNHHCFSYYDYLDKKFSYNNEPNQTNRFYYSTNHINRSIVCNDKKFKIYYNFSKSFTNIAIIYYYYSIRILFNVPEFDRQVFFIPISHHRVEIVTFIFLPLS